MKRKFYTFQELSKEIPGLEKLDGRISETIIPVVILVDKWAEENKKSLFQIIPSQNDAVIFIFNEISEKE